MSEKTVTAIMDQAQVFASSWSIVDGPFAAGNQIDLARAEKATLKKMVVAALSGEVGVLEEVAEMIEALLAWHKRQVDQLQIITDNAKEGVSIQLGTTDPVELLLTDDMAKGLRLGLSLAVARLGKLPISVSHDCHDDLDPDEDE
ncbi:hypothetical protein [Pseudomonas sp. FP1742]|uniref:hypothetical protein n=1 Tax=Pseudomonas sp. FP1742 TaxID=2954079 RepID=UPI0027365700|nr:hypothetical protein [Pseudomonas sp. FP1742]WLG49092.1 hypothetical protein PSH64_20450 [Pseudomonas sp. FP1742]